MRLRYQSPRPEAHAAASIAIAAQKMSGRRFFLFFSLVAFECIEVRKKVLRLKAVNSNACAVLKCARETAFRQAKRDNLSRIEDSLSPCQGNWNHEMNIEALAKPLAAATARRPPVPQHLFSPEMEGGTPLPPFSWRVFARVTCHAHNSCQFGPVPSPWRASCYTLDQRMLSKAWE
jgi:hypothetical protein